ncbi:putative DNA helicase [Lupinus albus]|uniref:Putative DNA helicase n=1 Tax=Lupinus albus TaxID=3870 RepID=A0A6A4R6R8_LUPAL|nr:putative DNA helicase [Lupinus albus]
MVITVADDGDIPNPHYCNPLNPSTPQNPTAYVIIRECDVIFHSHTIRTVVTSSSSKLDSRIADTLAIPSQFHSTIVGFDAEWNPNTTAARNPIATIQLYAGEQCMIFQILHAPLIPRSLIHFLINPYVTFVGVGIVDDVIKLREDYSLNVPGFIDVAEFAAEEFNEKGLKNAGIKTMSLRFLGLEFEKPKRVSRSRWDRVCLTPEQVQYASVDAFLSYQLGNCLIGPEYL